MVDDITKGKVIGMREAGLKFDQIAEKLELPSGTVKTIYYRHEEGKPSKKMGRPTEVTNKEKKKIIKVTEENPFMSYEAIKLKAGVSCDTRTVNRIANADGIKNHNLNNKGAISMMDMDLRLDFCEQYGEKDASFWNGTASEGLHFCMDGAEFKKVKDPERELKLMTGQVPRSLRDRKCVDF